jgi:hypothetical protein
MLRVSEIYLLAVLLLIIHQKTQEIPVQLKNHHQTNLAERVFMMLSLEKKVKIIWTELKKKKKTTWLRS